jgi:hypothetical protein
MLEPEIQMWEIRREVLITFPCVYNEATETSPPLVDILIR